MFDQANKTLQMISLSLPNNMVFLTIESANKAEINILLARDTTKPGPWARASWVMMQWYIRGSKHVKPPLADDKFILV